MNVLWTLWIPAPDARALHQCGASPSGPLLQHALRRRAKTMPKDVEGLMTAQAGKPMASSLLQYKEEK
jgi:hypothetical protein